MKLWVVGVEGLVGSALREGLVERGIDFVGSGHRDVDVTKVGDVERVAREVKPTHIINCSAVAHVDRCEEESQRAFAVNGKGPGHLGELGVWVLHLSTDYVFDGKSQRPYREEDPVAPLQVYGKSKLEGERELIRASPESCIVRTSWIFGGKKGLTAPKRAATDQISRPTYVYDLVEMMLALLGEKGIYHCANEGVCSRFEQASYLSGDVMGVTQAELGLKALRPHYSALDLSKITRFMGKAPRHWKEAIHG